MGKHEEFEFVLWGLLTVYEPDSFTCKQDLEQHADLERLQVYFNTMVVIMILHIPV